MSLARKNRARRFSTVFVSLLAFSIVGGGQAQADFAGDFAPSNWTYSETNTTANGPSGTLTSSQMEITSADWANITAPNTSASYSITIPSFYGLVTFNYSYVTRDRDGSFYDMPSYTLNGVRTDLVRPNIPDNGTESGTVVLDFTGLAGATFSIDQRCNDCILDSATITITNFSARFVPTPSALRQDSPATITEKNNVVTCTPGAYTFLNGGSTAEKSKIQSFVYTLLVNGKAVSTLSSDGFKSVASHLFPTIAGNMAGTATLEGATWDLKGMSNYSASCQVYATQSGANLQTTTATTYDSVALAQQAAEAEKVRMAKEMIANWQTANQDLSAKYRDQRLAAQP